MNPLPAPRRAVLTFDRGTLLLEPAAAFEEEAPPGFVADPRAAGRLRAPASAYRRGLSWLLRAGVEVDDRARAYEELALEPLRRRVPFPHQAEAVEAWWRAGKRGVVVLPTGAGKSYVAELILARVGRSSLVVAPTIDLMNQWRSLLAASFGDALVGGLGGGLSDVRPITVTTYDSAWIHAERLGNRFGLLVFDECHHLPGPTLAQSAELSLAPFRLGLTATPERQDGGDEVLETLVGPIVYRKEIRDLAGEVLAEYETIRLSVALEPDEREAWERARREYRAFVLSEGIRMSRPGGWADFLRKSCRSRRGRAAWHAWREQRRIALRSRQKLSLLESLLVRHAAEQVLVFTADNDTVHEISRRHLVPAITHETPPEERREVLRRFHEGVWRVVVTSRVLNEGVDMPSASVAIVLSGSASVREHVQRLGRILRRQEGKQAVLYEVVTEGTGEVDTSERRREHVAYR